MTVGSADERDIPGLETVSSVDRIEPVCGLGNDHPLRVLLQDGANLAPP